MMENQASPPEILDDAFEEIEEMTEGEEGKPSGQRSISSGVEATTMASHEKAQHLENGSHTDEPSAITRDTVANRLRDYFNVVQECRESLEDSLASRFMIVSDVRVDKYVLDFVGVSSDKSPDLLFEVKYAAKGFNFPILKKLLWCYWRAQRPIQEDMRQTVAV